MGNNPVMMVDPDGEWVHIAVGAVVGAVVGGVTYANQGKNVLAGIGIGAAIGAGAAATGGAIAGAGGGAMLAGAGGGAVGGAGFSGMQSNWNGEEMVKGAAIGAASGLVGGGFASAIGGGAGAFAGGVASDMTSQLLSTGDVNVGRSLLSGGMSFGMYHAMSYGSFKAAGGMLGSGSSQVHATYRQWNQMQALYQRSRFWNREHGRIYLNDGRVIKPERSTRGSVEWRSPDADGYDAYTDVKFGFHTHHDKPGKLFWSKANGDMIRNKDLGQYGGSTDIKLARVARYHGSSDTGSPFPTIVINRYDSSILMSNRDRFQFLGGRGIVPFNDSFLRWFPYFAF